MHKRTTEHFHPAASGIDALPYPEIAGHLLTAQMDALSAVEPAIEDLSKAATLMARTVRNGDRLIYAAAGSSGLMAAADALELPGTFGISADRIRIFMAGGLPTGSEMPGATEDDAQSAEAAAQNISAGDVVIAVSASGSTPYAVALARAAREAGAKTICIANNSDAPLFEHATVAICLPTPPEVVAGSTRLGAATSQKAALNIMSTLMGVALGHVHDGLMVNVQVENAKLKERAIGIVSHIADVPADAAEAYLAGTDGQVKPAVLMAAGAGSAAKAQELLEACDGQLRATLATLNETT